MTNIIHGDDFCLCGSGKKYKNCCGKIALTRNDFVESFKESIMFLLTSITAYDAGVKSEAKRIALEIRKMVHQTQSSNSIIDLLGKKDIAWISSFDEKNNDEFNEPRLAEFVITIQKGTAKIKNGESKPILGFLGDCENVKDFDSWWQEEIYIDNYKKGYTRKEIILLLSNKDNGAHVDLEIDKEYYEITRERGIGFSVEQGGKSFCGKDIMFAIVRQIAHEMIFSFARDEELKKTIIEQYVKRYSK